jgi:hypothetical protein
VKGMKTYLIFLVVLFPLSLYSSEGVLKKVRIKFSGGIVNLNGGDINTLSNFWNKYFSEYERYDNLSSKHTWENWSEGSHWKYQIEGILY